MKLLFPSFVVAILLSTACNTATETSLVETPGASVFNLDSVKAAIASSNQLYNESIAKNDSAMFVDRYTSDGILMAPNMPPFVGSAGVAVFFKAATMQMGIKGLTLTTANVYGEGDYVTEEGIYELFVADNKSVDKGKFLVLWKKTDAGWKMHRDIFNSDSPPPPPAK